MRQAQIESWIKTLRASFGPVRTPVAETRLDELYKERDYGRMLYQVKSTLHLDIKLALGLVNSGGPKNAPAWVEMPSLMPLVGTPAFRALTVPVYIRKSFIEESLFEQVVLAMAHELCHVVLNATSHPLRQQEEAVDLTAMLLGFRDFYVTGCQRRVEMYVPHPHEAVWEKRHITYSHGYLTIEEVGYAAEYMTYR